MKVSCRPEFRKELGKLFILDMSKKGSTDIWWSFVMLFIMCKKLYILASVFFRKDDKYVHI